MYNFNHSFALLRVYTPIIPYNSYDLKSVWLNFHVSITIITSKFLLIIYTIMLN